MAIFRGTTGTGSSDNTIVSAVTEQAGIATTKASEAEGFRDEAEGFKNTASSQANLATTKANEASADASGADSQRQLCVALRLEAYDSAQDALASANAAEASATTANSSAVQTVAGSNTQVVGVYNNIANVNTVAGVNTDVTTVAGISSDVTTVAADASDIGTVSTNIANVNNVGNNIANVNAVHSNASNINTVAADGTDIGTVATNIANVNTVAGISSTVTTVAGLESKMDTVIADASDIGAVAGNIGDVTTVAGINSDVDTVAGIAAKVTTVADNISDVQNADTNATNAASSASNASASATSASNSATTATTKATEASNSATAASNSATTATTKASQAAGSATTAGTSASTATTKASEASASATTATTKAGEAASSASAASGSATTATTKAAEADASATSAASSATKSSNAASTWNNFYNSYLGVADAPPSVDVLGNAIVAGALYYDTGAGSNAVGLYVYNGSSWVYSTNYNNVTAPYTLAQNLNADGNNITAVGSLGIGTASPSSALDVVGSYGTTPVKLLRHGDNGSVVTLGRNGVDAGVTFDYPASNTLGISTNNTERMRINSSGRVGIGTTSPANDLHISSATGSARLTSTVGGANVYMESADNNNTRIRWSSNANFAIRNDTTATDVVTINQLGRVGIGTTSPSKTLTVGGSGLRVQSTTSADFYSTGQDALIVNNGTANFKFWNNGSERLRIDSSGNVGIGTSNPNRVLHVEGTATTFGSTRSVLQIADDTAMAAGVGGGILFTGKAITGQGDSNTAFAGIHGEKEDGTSTNTAGAMLFSTRTSGFSPSERMRIDSSGRVGIGVTSPTGKVQIYKGGQSSYQTYTNTNSGLILQSYQSQGNPYTKTSDIVAGSDGTVPSEIRLLTRTAGSSSVDERLRIDSSGNVGIGTTSPSTFNTSNGAGNLVVGSGSGAEGITVYSGTTSNGALCFADGTSSTDTYKGYVQYNHNTNSMQFATGHTERMRIDSSGNVGIGTSSITDKLTVNGGIKAIQSDSVNTSAIALDFGSDIARVRSTVNGTGTQRPLGFFIGGSEKARIDSSGNLLVGKTSATATDLGCQIEADGQIKTTSNQQSALTLNRKTNDGSIAIFQKDGTSVGSVGTSQGNAYYAGTNTGITFGSANLYPINSSGTKTDAALDLGSSGQRFKDLYLSGGVHLGGTGTANKLDDYEEGTFTPTLTFGGNDTGNVYGATVGKYTKIGDTVHVSVYVRLTTLGSATGNAEISNLPFASDSNTEGGLSISYFAALFGLTSLPMARTFGTKIELRDSSATQAIRMTHGNFTTTSDIRVSGTYKTTA